MTEREVVDLMMTSTSPRRWDENADKVKAAFDGKYPSFWFSAVVQSGIMDWVRSSWRKPPANDVPESYMKF